MSLYNYLWPPLPGEFYYDDTVTVAKNLLGKLLCRSTERHVAAGIIVETEAYLSEGDPACHAARGMTRRNAPMFGTPGSAYVYFIYGKYNCFNVVTNKPGKGEAVLVRALEPVMGEDLMCRLRGGITERTALAGGPGRLCQALNIDRSLNEHDLMRPPLWIASGGEIKRFKIIETARIGISRGAALPLRFYIEGSHYISRR